VKAWAGCTVAEFLATPAERLLAELADAQLHRNLPGNAATRRSWQRTIELLRVALAFPGAAGWTLLLEYPLLRIGRRADAVILTPHAIMVLEFKTGDTGDLRAAARQADDYAQDLHDFHGGCRNWPVIPLAVTAKGPRHPSAPVLIWHGVAPVQSIADLDLPQALSDIAASVLPSRSDLDAEWWLAQPYRPIPNIVEAARMAFARQAVPDIHAARAEPGGLKSTTAAVLAEVTAARIHRQRRVVFVTGIPGAGKTRCGLAVAFEADDLDRGVFLTGNPTLVHVFREALARDAAKSGTPIALARQRMEGKIQALPQFRDHHVQTGHTPDEHVIVIDEAQRSWSRGHAMRKTRDKRVPLSDSEPAHILDAMARHDDWAVVVCLVGGGQEIHDGEGGLAEWGVALLERPEWRGIASPMVLAAADPRQRLQANALSECRAELHLDVPVRNIRGPYAAEWVDALLRDDIAAAQDAAGADALPFFVTRDLDAMRDALRRNARGLRRAGLVASSGAKRLRADGLGAELPHMDAKAVARWFLDRWPEDVRASNALEVVATEFCCQGLELDHVGVAWGGDLIRGRGGWQVRRFHGTAWQARTEAEAISNAVNTYRVLLTRARYQTVIWVPRGSADDRTRSPAEMDAIATHLLACGARPLEPSAAGTGGPPPPDLLTVLRDTAPA
jgi:hypothetical protein